MKTITPNRIAVMRHRSIILIQGSSIYIYRNVPLVNLTQSLLSYAYRQEFLLLAIFNVLYNCKFHNNLHIFFMDRYIRRLPRIVPVVSTDS